MVWRELLAAPDETAFEANAAAACKQQLSCFDFGLHAMMRRTALLSFGEQQCPARLTLPN
jgi:hypothetical protein